MVTNGTDRAPKCEDEIDTVVGRFAGPHAEFGLGDPANGNEAVSEQPDATARYDEAFMVKVARELERGELPTVGPPHGTRPELEPEALDPGKQATSAPRDAVPRELFPGGAWRLPIASIQGSERHHPPAKAQSRGRRAVRVVLSVGLVAVVSFVVSVGCAAGPDWRMAQLNAFLGLLGP